MDKDDWKIVTPNKDGRIKCFGCSKTFGSMYTAKIHQNRCFRQRTQKTKYELEQIQHGWVVCQRCQKTFFSMENARLHYKLEHIDINDDILNKTIPELR